MTLVGCDDRKGFRRMEGRNGGKEGRASEAARRSGGRGRGRADERGTSLTRTAVATATWMESTDTSWREKECALRTSGTVNIGCEVHIIPAPEIVWVHSYDMGMRLC